MDVKESSELLDFVKSYVLDLAKEKSDDGKLDLSEVAKVSIANAPAGVKAVLGVDKIGAELAELDPEEIKLLAEKGIALADAVLKLAGIVKA